MNYKIWKSLRIKNWEKLEVIAEIRQKLSCEIKNVWNIF